MNRSNRQPQVVDETTLGAFRAERLSPAALIALVTKHVQVLVKIAVGVGKSKAVDGLLACSATFSAFDYIVYVAPTWKIINERAIIRGATDPGVQWMVIRPRPRERCGGLDEEWQALEKRGCAALARRILCDRCPHRGGARPCEWPQQFKRAAKVRLVFFTEQQLLQNPYLFDILAMRAHAARPLLIMDEGKLVGASFEEIITDDELRLFALVLRALAASQSDSRRLMSATADVVESLRQADTREIEGFKGRASSLLNLHAADIQAIGVEQFGPRFRYLGYVLVALTRARDIARWKDVDGTIHFTSRPNAQRHLLVLSANLDDRHVARRLGIGQIESPFRDYRFQHSGTRIFNLKNRIGAARYFVKNSDQILGTVAALVARNIAAGRSTVLVSRKNLKTLCAEKMSAKLRAWGWNVTFLVGTKDALPAVPDPSIVPIIHYGILGTNTYEAYDAVYCLNSYYVSDTVLNDAVNESEPERFKALLTIMTGAQMVRQVELVTPRDEVRDVLPIAERHLHHLEVDPVIQAAGRVRFATKPREVLFFAMHDLHGDIADYTEVLSLVALREAMGIADPSDIDAAVEASRLVEIVKNGATFADAALSLGISRRTAFRRLKICESAKSPNIYIKKGFWHSVGNSASTGGAE